MQTYTLKIPEMMCSHCEKRIRTALENTGGSVLSIDMKEKIAVFEVPFDATKLISIIDEVGYDAEII